MPIARIITGDKSQALVQDSTSRAVRALEESQGYPFGKPGTLITQDQSVLKFGEMNRVDPSAGPLTVKLPTIGTRLGRSLTVVNTTSSTNKITIQAAPGTLINNATSISIQSAFDRTQLVAVNPTLWTPTFTPTIPSQVPNDNLPILAYSSASVVNAQSRPGRSTGLLATLSDNSQYTATSPLTINLATSGAGGLDTGSEASSTWYYAYAIPDTGNPGQFVCCCSVTGPATGPTGLGAFRYLGAFRNNASSNIRPFDQYGNEFRTRVDVTDTTCKVLDTNTTATAAWTSLTISPAVPTTVSSKVYGRCAISAGSSQVVRLFIEAGNAAYTPLTSGGTSFGLAANTGNNGSQSDNDFSRIMFDGTLYYWTMMASGSGNIVVVIYVTGWTDSYLEA